MRILLTKTRGLDLPAENFPKEGLEVSHVDVEEDKFKILGQALSRGVDQDLKALVENLGAQLDLEIPIVATAGLPAPYDAWTKEVKGKTTIHFNLSQWTIAEIKLSAHAIFTHEATHLYLHPFLSPEGTLSYSERLERIVLDEGIAHLMGFVGDREDLFGKWIDKQDEAESELQRTFLKLSSFRESNAQKELLLERSNTGPFWEKFGAIAGMFRAARLFNERGIEGLCQAIRNQRLPRHY